MSYNVYLEADTGGPEPAEIWWANYTTNCAPMWRKAGAPLHEWDGRKAEYVVPLLEVAIDTMKANPDEYAAMNPENGWGDHLSVIRFLEEFVAAARHHPKTTVRISR